MQNNITGLYVPLVTPFYQGAFDRVSMKRLVRSLEHVVNGFIPCLSSGEGEKLTTAEWEAIVTLVCSITDKPVFAGILRKSEKEVFSLIQKASKLPCAGIAIPTLYDTDAKNVRYLKKVAKLSNKKILLYNTEKHPLKNVRTIVMLDALPKIIAMKDSAMNVSFFKKLAALKRSNKLRMDILQGMEHLIPQSAGCDGYVISLLNTEPKVCKDLLQKHGKKENHKMFKKFWEHNLGGTWYVSLKAILYERGIIRSAEEINPVIKPL